MNKTSNLMKLLAGLVALVFVAAACGGDDASSEDQAVIDAVVAQLTADGDVPPGVDVGCMAKAMVTGFGGAAELESKFGLTVESLNAGQSLDDVELPKEQALSVTDGMFDCGLDQVFANEIGEDMSQDEADCLIKNLDQDAMREMFAADLMSEAEAAAIGEAAEEKLFSSLFTAMGECNISPSSLGL